MAQVLIVGKTRMGDGICLGGIVVGGSNRSVRLLPQSGIDHPMDTDYELRDLWNLELKELHRSRKHAPHSEDVRVLSKVRIRKASPQELRDFIVNRVGAPLVKPRQLFDGRLQFTRNRRAYITPKTKIPLYSTGFWRFEQALHLQQQTNRAGNLNMRYVTGDKSLDVKYVGLEEPIEAIPPGAILRFSLTHWWGDKPAGFWLQLSGWFL